MPRFTDLARPTSVAAMGGGAGGGGAGGGGARGYNPAYGGVPQLAPTGALQSNLTNILNQAIPGYTGLTQSASSIIGDSMSGKLPSDVQDVIRNASATQAVASGMPGSNATGGTLYGNRTLRDLGITSLQRKDQGVKDFLSFLQGVSGAAAPTFGQLQDQENGRKIYDAAPVPSEAMAEQERLFNKYSGPSGGTMRTTSNNDWWNNPYNRGSPQSNQVLSFVQSAGR